MKRGILSLVASIALASTLSLANDKVYAVVDGEEITSTEINLVLRDPRIDFETLPAETKERVISQVIEKKLLTKKAVSSGIEKLPQYKETLNKIKKDLALELWMQEEYKKVTVSEKDAKDFYNKNQDKFKTKDMLEARHILLKDEKAAKEVISELDKAKDKKAKFIELAKAKSTGPTGKDGGYLGRFAPAQMVPEFSKAASELEVGTYTKTPVKTQFGYHIIYLEGKDMSKVMKFEEVKDKIEQSVIQEKFRDKIKAISDEIRKSTKIEIKK